MVESENIKQIVTVLHGTPRVAITLRRAFGKPLNALTTKEKGAYLEATNGIEPFNNLNVTNWFIVSLLAKQLDMQSSKYISDYLHDLYHDSNSSDSIKHRITKLLEVRDKQKLVKELSWFAKHANNNEIRINEYSLYEDVTFWNEKVAYKWSRAIIREKEKTHA